MNRLYASIAIIISVLLLDVYSHRIMLTEGQYLTGIIENIMEYEETENTEAALKEVKKLSDGWEESRKKLAPYVSDRNLDEISDSIAKMGPLIISDSDETAAESEYIKRKLLHIHMKDLPFFHNIF